MPIERWQELTTYELPNPPQPLLMTSLWLCVADLLPAKRLIRIIASSGSWANLRTGPPIGPDGYLDSPTSTESTTGQMIVPSAPLGALIGKIGGSTADKIIVAPDKKIEGMTIFPIGTFCVVAPLDKAAPLFVAVNGAWSVAQFQFLTLKVEVSTSEQ